MARTQQERRADTRERLLGAAALLFAEHGVDAVSVDTVAEAAGRTSGAVYDHFGSKQGMLLALLDEGAQSLVTVIAAEFELAADIDDRLRAVAANVVTHPSEQTRRLMRLERELWLRAGRDEEVATALRERAREAHDRMARGFATWMAEGIIPADASADTLATVFGALVVGLEMRQRAEPGVLDVDEVARALGSVLGVGVPGADEAPGRPRVGRTSSPT